MLAIYCRFPLTLFFLKPSAVTSCIVYGKPDAGFKISDKPSLSAECVPFLRAMAGTGFIELPLVSLYIPLSVSSLPCPLAAFTGYLIAQSTAIFVNQIQLPSLSGQEDLS